MAQYLAKGKQVYAEGQSEARSFQRNDGIPGFSLSLRIRELQLLVGHGDSAGTASYQPNATAAETASNSNIPSPSYISEPGDD